MFWVKLLTFFDLDPGSEMEKFGSVIRDKHPGSATLVPPAFSLLSQVCNKANASCSGPRRRRSSSSSRRSLQARAAAAARRRSGSGRGSSTRTAQRRPPPTDRPRKGPPRRPRLNERNRRRPLSLSRRFL